MHFVVLLLLTTLPVQQVDQTEDNIRSTVDLEETYLDSVQLPSIPLVESPQTHLDGSHKTLSRSLGGSWQLSWNDDVKDETFQKSCDIKFDDVDGTLTGSFVGPVAGRKRDAIISGHLEGSGTTRILTFQQRESGYICSYQGIENGGEISGVWHDTENRSGSFRLLKYQ